ncbi:MAG TPA: DNA gyrase inhibitor YacG [Reyranella sp.]|jgi:endogenous inhibitor of DNA gyrase (YacG/DUF329 family)|nr:DNA gyrase inhibitor YacG [Reyranella sp.]
MPPESPEPPAGERKQATCPICGKPASEATRPFCSSRCRDVDLNRWLKGIYVVPGAESGEDDVE